MTQLLDTIQVVETARPGESVQVQITLTQDAPPDTQVLVFGLCAHNVWLQTPGRLGQWKVPVIATSGDQVEQRLVTVEVSGTPAAPVLDLARNPFTPLSVVLRATDLDPPNPLLVTGDIYRWRIGAVDAVTGEPVVAQDLAFQVNDQAAWTALLVQ